MHGGYGGSWAWTSVKKAITRSVWPRTAKRPHDAALPDTEAMRRIADLHPGTAVPLPRPGRAAHSRPRQTRRDHHSPRTSHGWPPR
ncbi:hypothetical protein GCM10010199_01500 [Dactylosporangium roseum]